MFCDSGALDQREADKREGEICEKGTSSGSLPKWRRPSIKTCTKRGFDALSGLIFLLACAVPADADNVTLTLQKLDISTQPVDQPFGVTVSIQKDQNNRVTIDIPPITQSFASSQGSPNADPSQPFPAFFYIPQTATVLPETLLPILHCRLTTHWAVILTP